MKFIKTPLGDWRIAPKSTFTAKSTINDFIFTNPAFQSLKRSLLNLLRACLSYMKYRKEKNKVRKLHIEK